MHSNLRWIAPALALGLISLFSGRFAKAADAPATQPSAAPTTQPATGSITVLVVDSDNQPVPDIQVRLFPPRQRHAAQQNQADNGPGAGGKGGKHRPAALATGTTDAKGSVTFDKIALGDYTIRAGKKGVGRGMANVTLSASTDGSPATATVTVTLQAAPAGGANPPAGGAGGNGGTGGTNTPTPPPSNGA